MAIRVLNAKNGRRESGKTVGKACEMCGTIKCKLHVHHRDHNPLNNAPTNLQTLCASCHKLCHSPNFDATTGQKKPCKHCSKPVARQGLCSTHLSRLKRHGDPLAKKVKTAFHLGWEMGRDL